MPSQLKCSPYVAVAIIGNWKRESHVNPGLWESLTVGTGGFGLGQWTGTRRTALFEYLDSHGFARDDGNGQLEYFYVEEDWQAVSSRPLKFNSLPEFLASTSTDIAALTETFMWAWERPGVPELQERIDFANKALAYIREHINDPAEWIAKNAYLSEAEQLNNALCVYRVLTTGQTPPTPGGTWMMGVYRELYRRRYIHR